jgi:hypothetical protein
VGRAFDTAGGFYEAPWSPSLFYNCGETNLSVEGWIFPYQTDLPYHVCGMRNDSYGDSRWQIGFYDELPSPPPGVWTHVAMTLGPSATPGCNTYRFYQNGVVRVANDAWSWGSGSNIHCTLRIGTSQDWAPFIGLIDELTYYNRALTANEIAAIYAAGSAGKVLPTLSITLLGEQVRLSWPAAATGFSLVSRTDLATGNWESVTNTPALNGTWKEVVLPINFPAQRFFRLNLGN